MLRVSTDRVAIRISPGAGETRSGARLACYFQQIANARVARVPSGSLKVREPPFSIAIDHTPCLVVTGRMQVDSAGEPVLPNKCEARRVP